VEADRSQVKGGRCAFDGCMPFNQALYSLLRGRALTGPEHVVRQEACNRCDSG
jgi:hypothetical protein